MKNYLIKGLHRIGSTKWWPGRDRADEGDLYSQYTEMDQISEISFCQHLAGDWELIRLRSDARDVNHVFRQQFFAIYDIWRSEPCNILYCGADTQMIKPTEVFGKYDQFLMWNYTDPKSYGAECPHFLNADIRYYPSNMSTELWDWALTEAERIEEWNSDQLLYNRMVWSQGLTPEQVIDPTMAYQGFGLPENLDFMNAWNGCNLDDAHIIHWHGSRGAAAKLQAMKNIYVHLIDVSVRDLPARDLDITNIG